MTLEQLRIFLAVAQHLHFTRAAESLYLSQPSVSAAIQNLEDTIGMPLFHRIGRRIEITQAGQLLRTEAQKILDQVTLTQRGLQELHGLQRGELKLGASQTIGNYWLPGFISQFKSHYPGIQVHCLLGNTQEISLGTVAGKFDLGLVEGIVPPSAVGCLDQQIVGGDRLQIVVGQNHPWFEQPRVSLEDLVEAAWVMREPESGIRAILEQALCEWGIEPASLNVILEMSSGEMIKAVIESGTGVTALSEWMVHKDLRFGILRSLEITDSTRSQLLPPITRSFKLLKHRERFQTRIAQCFEDLLRSTAKQET